MGCPGRCRWWRGIDNGLAAAQRSATPGSVSLFFTSQNGDMLRFRIGDDTVQAWALIYQPVSAPVISPAQGTIPWR